MRLLAVIGCAAALVTSSAASESPTILTITYLADSARPANRVQWTVRCGPPRGTHPRRAAVCRELSHLGRRAFAPVPKDVACAELYGGPQAAIVSGRVAGRRVWARLTRIDGCQIDRWRRVRSLLPAGGVR